MEPTCYFRDTKGVYHELSGDRPGILPDGEGGMLKDMPIGTTISTWLNERWIEGTRMPKPVERVFHVSCISFEDETKVWEALEKALNGLHGKPNSPIPWLKITPPTRIITPGEPK